MKKEFVKKWIAQENTGNYELAMKDLDKLLEVHETLIKDECNSLDNWISVDSEIKDSIEFFRANGFSENNYIASHVKSVLDSNNEPDDDSEILSREFQDNLENIHKLLFNIISPPPQPPKQSTKKRGGCPQD